jgi:predicted membrane GTPase involved in stress response
MRIVTLLVCGILFISATGPASPQTSFYDVIVAGRHIGSLKVFNYMEKDDVEMHRIESEFKVLFYSGKYSIQSSFAQGKLVSSVAAHHVNGDLKEKTQTKSTVNPLYEVLFSGSDAPKDDKKELNYPISNTVTSLYYKEPVNIKEVYSERYGLMCTVKKLSEGHYGVSLPDGKQGIYTYKNGQCREVNTDLAGFKLKIVLNDSKTSAK